VVSKKSPTEIIAMAVKLVQMGKVHCLGWSHARLVHDSHIRSWQSTFGSKQAPAPKIEGGVIKPVRADPDQHATEMTYQWLDIYGQVNEAELKLAHNSVLGHIYMRPGVNEASLAESTTNEPGHHADNVLSLAAHRRACYGGL
jgi:hypothetical protein